MKRNLLWFLGGIVLGSIAAVVLARHLDEQEENDPYTQERNWGV